MAGDVKITVVSGQLATGASGTADFTEPGFGTPLACIVIASFDDSDDTSIAAQSKVSIGLSDFTTNLCVSHQDEDASASVDCDTIKKQNACYHVLAVNGSIEVNGRATTITDGVRLTNLNNPSGVAPFVTVIMVGGADLTISLNEEAIDATEDDTSTRAHANFTDGNDKLVFFIGTDIAAESSSKTGINNSFGVCHITGNDAGGYTFSQRSIGWASDHNAAEGAPHSELCTDRVLNIITEAGAADWGLEVTGFSSSGNTLTVTTRDNSAGNGMEVYSLALDLDDRKAKVGSVDGPTSGVTWSITGMGFKPQYVGLALTDLSVESTARAGIETDDVQAGVHGISSNAGSGAETCHSWYNEDAAATTNTNNLFRSRAIDLRDDNVTTVLQDHSHSSFDSGGVTHTINTENETVAKKWFFCAIEEAAAAGDISFNPSPGELELTTTSPPQQIITSAPSGELSITTEPPTVLQTLDIQRDPLAGELSLTTTIPTIDVTLNIPKTPAAADLDLTAVGPTQELLVRPASGELELTTTAPSVGTDISLTIPTGELDLTTASPSQQFNLPITSGDLSLTTTIPAILQTLDIERLPASGELSITTVGPSQQLNLPVASSELSLTTTITSILQTFDVARSAPTGELSLTTIPVTQQISIPISAGELDLTTTVPVVSETSNVERVPAAGDLLLTTTSVSQQLNLPVVSGELSITTTVPSVFTSGDINLAPATGEISLTTVPVTQQLNVPVTSGDLALTTTAVTQQVNLPIPPAEFSIDSTVPLITQTFDILRTPAAADLEITTASISQQLNLHISAGKLAITTTTPTALQTLDVQRDPSTGELALTTTPVTLQTNLPVAPAELAINSSIPSVVVTLDVQRTPPSAELILDTSSPGLETRLTPPPSELSITTTAPAVLSVGALEFTPANDNLELDTTPPIVQLITFRTPGAGNLAIDTTAPEVVSPITPEARIFTLPARVDCVVPSSNRSRVVAAVGRTFTVPDA